MGKKKSNNGASTTKAHVQNGAAKKKASPKDENFEDVTFFSSPIT